LGEGVIPLPLYKKEHFMELIDYSLFVGKRNLFKDVNIEFQNGIVSHLLGGNGVGKSSFAKSMIGMISYDGEVKCDKNICVIGSYTNIPNDLTIRDLMLVVKDLKNTEQFNEIFDLLNIKDIDKNLRLSKMSDGQKQKIKLLFFLSKKPNVVILDEFTSSLDKKSMLDIYKFINKFVELKNVLIINITHNLLDIEYIHGNYYYVSNNKITQYKDKESLIKDYTNLI